MPFHLITIAKELLENQGTNQIYLPLTRNYQKKVKLRIKDHTLIFTSPIGETIVNSKFLGIYKVLTLNRKNEFQAELPIKVGTHFVAKLKAIEVIGSKSATIKDILKDSNVLKINQSLKIKNKQPIIFSISEKQYNILSNAPLKEIEMLENALKNVGKRLQKKVGAGWLYNIGTSQIYNLSNFIKLNMNDDLVSEYIRNKLEIEPNSANKYYDLIESFADENILNLSWDNFEKRVTRLASKMGFKATKSQKTGDGGIDVYVEDLKLFTRGKYIIQCKRTEKPIGVKDVKDLDSTIGTENALKGILISVSGFSKPAYDYAEKVKNRIELLPWSNILDYLRNQRQINKS